MSWRLPFSVKPHTLLAKLCIYKCTFLWGESLAFLIVESFSAGKDFAPRVHLAMSGRHMEENSPNWEGEWVEGLLQ